MNTSIICDVIAFRAAEAAENSAASVVRKMTRLARSQTGRSLLWFMCFPAIIPTFQPPDPVVAQLVQKCLQGSLLLGRERGKQLSPTVQNMFLVALGNPSPALLCDGQGHLSPIILTAHPGNETFTLQFGGGFARRRNGKDQTEKVNYSCDCCSALWAATGRPWLCVSSSSGSERSA